MCCRRIYKLDPWFVTLWYLVAWIIIIAHNECRNNARLVSDTTYILLFVISMHVAYLNISAVSRPSQCPSLDLSLLLMCQLS